MCRYFMDLALCASESGCCGRGWLYTKAQSPCDKCIDPNCPDGLISMGKIEFIPKRLPKMPCFTCSEKFLVPRLVLPEVANDPLHTSIQEAYESAESWGEEDDESYTELPSEGDEEEEEGWWTDEDSVRSGDSVRFGETEDSTVPEPAVETPVAAVCASTHQEDGMWPNQDSYSCMEQCSPAADGAWEAYVMPEWYRGESFADPYITPETEEHRELDHDLQSSVPVTAPYEQHFGADGKWTFRAAREVAKPRETPKVITTALPSRPIEKASTSSTQANAWMPHSSTPTRAIPVFTGKRHYYDGFAAPKSTVAPLDLKSNGDEQEFW